MFQCNVLATEDPEIIPVIPDQEWQLLLDLLFYPFDAKSKKYLPPPAVSKKAPNKTNRNIKSTETPIGIPKIAS